MRKINRKKKKHIIKAKPQAVRMPSYLNFFFD